MPVHEDVDLDDVAVDATCKHVPTGGGGNGLESSAEVAFGEAPRQLSARMLSHAEAVRGRPRAQGEDYAPCRDMGQL